MAIDMYTMLRFLREREDAQPGMSLSGATLLSEAAHLEEQPMLARNNVAGALRELKRREWIAWEYQGWLNGPAEPPISLVGEDTIQWVREIFVTGAGHQALAQHSVPSQPPINFSDPTSAPVELADAADALLVYGISIAEGKAAEISVASYRSAHRRVMTDPVARQAASGLLARLTTPDLMWGHLRSKASGSGSWQLRREEVHALLDPVLDAINRGDHPADALMGEAAERLNADSVRDAWTRALTRRETDPEGAVTIARTLLESTLKTILDDRDVAYERKDDLPKLYRAVGGQLGLSPDGYSEEAFRQILGGCSSVVTGLGSLRNQVSDSHGSGRTRYRPAARHAALAVNLAGSMALFLIETHEATTT